MHPVLASGRARSLHAVAWGVSIGALVLLVRALVGLPWPAAILFGAPLGILAGPVTGSAWFVSRAIPLAGPGGVRSIATAVLSAAIAGSIWAAAGRLWWAVLAGSGIVNGSAPAALAPMLVGLGLVSFVLALTVYVAVAAVDASAAAARRALEAQVAERDAELRALRAQIDPHFLFNSLNSVAGLVGADPARAREMCQRLAEFLRETLRLGGTAHIPLSREVDLARQYLRVEQLRFGARLQIHADVDPASAPVLVPPLILQPLVENAVRHGIATRLDGGTVGIEARIFGARALLTVTNPRDPDAGRRGIGLGQDLVRRRLAATFGERAALRTEAMPDAYRASITVPLEADA